MNDQTTVPLTNDPAARTADGTLKDASTLTTTPATTSTTEAPADGTPPKSADATTADPAKATSLLDQPDAKPAATVAPDKYEAFNAPDGVTLDPTVIEQATPIFKELGLTQEQAQRLIAFQAEREKTAAGAGTKAYNDLRADWQKATLANAEVAVNGKLKPEVHTAMANMFNEVGKTDPALVKDFKEVMNLTGAGDHPAFVRLIHKLSSSFAEGKAVSGGGPSEHGQAKPNGGAPKSAANAIYPHLS